MRIRLIRFLLPLIIPFVWACGINSQSVPTSQSAPAVQNPPNPPKPVVVKPASILSDNTLFTVYGRFFGRAPILGRLGAYKDFAEMEKDIAPWIEGIQKRHDKKNVIPAVHLIYAMATPCQDSPDCLLYIEGSIKDLVRSYIEPAAKRGWMVVLDTQLGKSDPVKQIRRILDKGYLKYENVAVALDPEFHVYPGRETPGLPIGTVDSSQINEVQQMLDDYVRTQKLQNKKILIVHQFGDANIDDGVPFMIKEKDKIKAFDNVELVLDMDGLGQRPIKVVKYNKITDAGVYPFVKFRGIKVFFRNRWEKHGHFDKPPLDLDEIFGIKKVKGGPKMETKPDVLIIA
ncbi:MAG TPA: hypothetical protein VMG30_18640 [Acidobacteriota bacterium]|nr:hypothetical protein [Acidobacteriota bacterium]